MPSDEKKPSRSGAITSSSGERHIPSSTRADGSVRKEIRIRPGYRPPEDIDVYRSKTAQAWRDRGKAGVPGADSTDSKPATQSASANKNAKRREARKKAAAAAGAGEGDDGDKNEPNPTEETSSAAPTAAPAEQQKDPEAEREKEAKKLAKKLRQARELKDKKDKGDSLLPEQFEKVIRISELVRQLDNLGFDSNGEKKQQETEKT
ncbi:rna binding protein pym [Diplodia corticola]|uniref:Rna binding protein pym n=1 Tax=Diplodia corticola TaxID=236234 RepID=A0A1J9SC15_9PEZI|nr:rna binding protein pym [Diplodia corticola]OJD37125.1 rna binding protein pym [Diplodia corticola]